MKELIRALLPRAIRPHRILAGPLRGRWIVTSWHDYPAGLTGRTERPLLDWFSQHVRAGDTWLDVGAHYGYTAFALAGLVGASGRVFTFEPVPATAGCVDQARMLNGLSQVTVVPFGLGNADALEMRRLPLTRGMADSTLAQDDLSWYAAVPFARFDWIWPLLNGSNDVVHGVKIDVQGMELDTLRGMQEMLERWHPHLVVELHSGVSRPEVLDLLQGAGYSRDAVAVEPDAGEHVPGLLDNRSYAFRPV